MASYVGYAYKGQIPLTELKMFDQFLLIGRSTYRSYQNYFLSGDLKNAEKFRKEFADHSAKVFPQINNGSELAKQCADKSHRFWSETRNLVSRDILEETFSQLIKECDVDCSEEEEALLKSDEKNSVKLWSFVCGDRLFVMMSNSAARVRLEGIKKLYQDLCLSATSQNKNSNNQIKFVDPYDEGIAALPKIKNAKPMIVEGGKLSCITNN